MSRIRRPSTTGGFGPAVTVVGVLALAFALIGCGATDPGRTGGMSLRYERREQPVGLAIWTVETDGSIEYSGGRDAIAGRATWSGVMDDATLDRLIAAAADVDRASVAPGERAGADEESSGVRTVLVIRDPGGRRRIAVDGDPAELAELLGILREATRPRLDAVLDRLPRATESTAAADETPGAPDPADSGALAPPDGGGEDGG